MASFCMSLNPFTATLSNLSSAEANDLHRNKNHSGKQQKTVLHSIAESCENGRDMRQLDDKQQRTF